MNPAAQLAELAARLESENPPTGSPEAVLVTAVRRWLEGDVETLDAALGLGGARGIERARTLYRRAQRDHNLRAAWHAVEASGPWSRSVRLAAEISRFETDIWPRWRDLDAPPAGASSLRRSLFHARRLGPLPSTARGLHDRVRSEPKPPY